MNRLSIFLVSLSTFLISAIGCTNLPPSQPVQPPIQQVPTPPNIVAFIATPDEIITGNSSTLWWNVVGAASIRIDQDIGNVLANGTTTVSPVTTTTYTIIASNDTGSITKSVTVNVKLPFTPTPPSSQETNPSPTLPPTPNLSDAEIKVDEYYGFVQEKGDTASSCCMIATIKNNNRYYSMVNVTLPGINGPVEVAKEIRPGEETRFMKCGLRCSYAGSPFDWQWELDKWAK